MDSLACQWLIQWLLQSEKWEDILAFSHKQKALGLKLVALKNLQKTLDPQDGCLSYFDEQDAKLEYFYKSCGDISLLRVLEGASDLKNERKTSEAFRAEVRHLRSLRQAKNRNLDMDLINDVRRPKNLSFPLSELYFFLPHMEKYRHLLTEI